MLKTKIFKKKSIFPVKKRFWPIFSQFLEHNKGQETIFDGPQGLFYTCFAIDKVVSLGPKMSIARNFSKISCSHADKSFWLTFHRIINCDKPPGTVCNCPQGLLTFTVEVMRSVLQDLRGCWKRNFLNKRQLFQWGKNYGSHFLVLSSVTNLKRRFVRILRVFSPLLCLL